MSTYSFPRWIFIRNNPIIFWWTITRSWQCHYVLLSIIVKDSYASYKIRFIIGKANNSAIFSRLSQSLWPNKFFDVARYRPRNARFLTILNCYLTTRQFIVLDTHNPRECAHFCLTGYINSRGFRRIVKRQIVRRIFSTMLMREFRKCFSFSSIALTLDIPLTDSHENRAISRRYRMYQIGFGNAIAVENLSEKSR